MKASPEVRKAIEEQLESLADAMASRDINAFMKLFSTDANILALNIEEDSMFIGPTQIKQNMETFFNNTDSIALKYGWTSIKAEGKIAWVATHVNFTIKKKGFQEVPLSTWLTGVLVEQKDDWLWIQYHLSAPYKIEAPELTPEEKAAEEAAEKGEEVAEVEAKPEEPEEPSEEDVFFELP